MFTHAGSATASLPAFRSLCTCTPTHREYCVVTSSGLQTVQLRKLGFPSFRQHLLRRGQAQRLYPRPVVRAQTTETQGRPPAEQMTDDGKTRVLFVCLGNICRSPTAEAMFQAVVERAGVADDFEIDSCGTGGGNPNWYKAGGWSHHHGGPADERMTEIAAERGVILTSRSRPLMPKDLTTFDYIIGMDPSNIAAIHQAADHWAGHFDVPKDYKPKVKTMVSYLKSDKFKKYGEVPDPYYGGRKGFELVLDLLEEACDGLLQTIEAEKKK